VLNRRSCIRSLVGVVGTRLIPPALKAALQCGPPTPPWGVQPCIAGIPQERLNMVFAYQQQSEWCWAACIEMVFGYWGHPITQLEIVKQTWGVIANMPAKPLDIIRDLNRSWQDRNGRQFEIRGDVFSANGATAAQDLAAEMPLIIGSLGHAMVLTAVSYNRAQNSQGQLTAAVVRDPFPGRGGRRPLSAIEAAGEMPLARIRVS
jgi:Papain-like cysteine protease AvrRpt2